MNHRIFDFSLDLLTSSLTVLRLYRIRLRYALLVFCRYFHTIYCCRKCSVNLLQERTISSVCTHELFDVVKHKLARVEFR
eukprot:g49390.t1